MATNERGEERELPPGIVRSKAKSITPPPSPPRSGEGSSVDGSGVSNEAIAVNGDRSPNELPSPLRGGDGGGVTSRRDAGGRGLPFNAARSVGDRGPKENRITAIEPQQKRKNRVNVFIDGAFAAGLFDTVAHDLGLRIGQEIIPQRLEEIARAETLRRAKEDAYNFLSFRARSEKEISDKLAQKEYEPDVIAKVVEHLRQAGLLDDEAFAQNWVSARGKTRGNRMLAHELRQKGVAQEVAAQTLTERGETDAEHTAAYQAAVKKVGQRPIDTSREARAKVAAHLARRGFGWDVVKPVLARLYENKEDESESEEISDSAE